MRSAVIAVLGIAVGAVAVIEPAAATEFETFGHPGDKQRRVDCPDGAYLVGFAGWKGDLLNALQPLCAPLLADASLGKRVKLKLYGGKGGSDTFTTYCGKNQIIQGWRVTLNQDERTVGELGFACYAPINGTSGQTRAISGNVSDYDYEGQSVECPPGELATGLKINYGKHVNGLGLICGEVVLPAAVEAEAPAPEPAPEPEPSPMEIADNFNGYWDTRVGDVRVDLALRVDRATGSVKGTMTSSDPALTGNFYGSLEPNGREVTYSTETNGGSSSGIIALINGREFEGGYVLNGNRQTWRGTK